MSTLYSITDQRLLSADDTSSDGGYDAELEGNSRHSRQRGSLDDSPQAVGLTRWVSLPGVFSGSMSSSPASLQRQNTLPRDRSNTQINGSTPALTTGESPRKSIANPPVSWTSSTGSRASRRLDWPAGICTIYHLRILSRA